jgi:hypothetical protein
VDSPAPKLPVTAQGCGSLPQRVSARDFTARALKFARKARFYSAARNLFAKRKAQITNPESPSSAATTATVAATGSDPVIVN